MRYKIILFSIISFALFSCSKLNERLNGQISGSEAQQIFGGSSGDVSTLLTAAYNALRDPYQGNDRLWLLQECTTDEQYVPTRGGDWDDNGVFRVLQTHQWDANHTRIADAYRDLGRIVFASTDVLRFNPSAQAAAEARFLRAFAMFSILDGWDQVPYRENTGDPYEVPKVRKGIEALNYIISEVNAIINNLPDGSPTTAYIANKDAARVLLMKCYLNKGVFANRQSPTFDASDMNQVITLGNQLIASGKYSLTNNFFDNFTTNNHTLSNELIFTSRNIGGTSGGPVRTRWYGITHYNQVPSGWNGFTTLGNFYDKFEANDTRRGADYTGLTDVTGLRVGLLFGQQYNQNGTPLQDRKGNPLSFTKEVKLIETGNNLEVTGVRVIKYVPDLVNTGDFAENDYVLFRYADVLLMVAEAYLRINDAASALPLINEVRTRAGASNLPSVNLDQLIDERGRELYWEGWRRQDLIRFGKFLQPTELRTQASNPTRLLFPIPSRSLSANPNLTQNPGY